MDMSPSAIGLKEAALREVGRTVVNFQRLEHNLKLAARLGPLSGTLQEMQRDVEKRVERAATLTLGQAIQAWLVAAHGELAEVGVTEDLFDVTMQVAISWVPDHEVRSAHATALKALLQARNKLIHGGLVHVSWDSPDDCRRLMASLDALNREIRLQMDFVTSILSAASSLSSLRAEDIEAAMEEVAPPVESGQKVVDDA